MRAQVRIGDAQSNVRKVSVNSTPEKSARKKKCRLRSALRTARRPSTVRLGLGGPVGAADLPFIWPFVWPFPLACAEPAAFCFSAVGATPLPRVSGSATTRKMVSTTSSTSVRNAGAA